MNANTANIDIQRCRLYYKLLIATFLGVVIPILLLITRLVPVAENGDLSVLAKLLSLTMVISALLYYVFLGILSSKNNKSVIVWVGLSMLTSPIGPVVSFFLIMGVGKQNGWA